MEFKNYSGQIALPFILLVSGIILEIAVAGSFVSYFITTAGAGDRLLVRATSVAQSGVRDAILRISQNKEYAASSVSYTLSIGSDSTAVAVSRNTSNATVYVYTITSTGSAGSRQKKYVATVSVNKITGATNIQSMVDTSVE